MSDDIAPMLTSITYRKDAITLGNLTYAYDAVGRRASMSVPGQAVIDYTYDNADRLTQITPAASSVMVGYDAANRPTSLTLPNGVVTEYGYDTASRLTNITYRNVVATLGNLTYDYDAAGHRTKMGGSFARTALPQPVSTTSYNSANQQTSFGTQVLSYDAAGNLTSDGINSYGWNARNQLVSVSGPTLAATFQYDALGKRIGKSINGTTTAFLYDGENVVQEQVGGSASANMLTGLGMDQVFLRSDSSGTSSLLTDALGSAIALADSSGVLQSWYSYEPFGNICQTWYRNGFWDPRLLFTCLHNIYYRTQ